MVLMGNLKKDYPNVRHRRFQSVSNRPLKRINLDNDEMNATILGQFRSEHQQHSTRLPAPAGGMNLPAATASM